VSGNPPTRTTSLPSESLRRICEAGQAAQVRGATSLRLTLRPAHLGSLTIELSMRGSLLRGKIRTETRAARELILAEMDRLRKALEDRGIRVGDLEVQVEAQPRRPVGGRPQKDGKPESEASEEAAPRSVRRGKLDVLA
jgi:flagellar hook-length control protein FliK